MWRDGWDGGFERRRDIDPGSGGGPVEEEPGGGGEEGGPPPVPEEPWEPPGGGEEPPAPLPTGGGPPPEPAEPDLPEGTTPIGPPGGGGDDDGGGSGGPPTVQVRIYEWRTAQDARVCPICGPLDGGRWEDDDGPFPPAHMGCRCARVLVAVETRTVSRRGPLGGGDDGGGARRRW